MDCHQPKVLEKPSGKSSMLFCDGCATWTAISRKSWRSRLVSQACCSVMDVTKVTTWTAISPKSWKSRLVSQACLFVLNISVISSCVNFDGKVMSFLQYFKKKKNGILLANRNIYNSE